MKKVWFLLVVFLAACAPLPIPEVLSPTPVSTLSPLLTGKHPGKLTFVEFFAVN